MRRKVPLAAGALSLFAFAIPAGANSDASALAISAWPARLVVTAPGNAVVGVGNPSDEPVPLVARAEAYALDLRGHPQIAPAKTRWFAAQPARLLVPPHGTTQVTLVVRRPAQAQPGDHAQLLLLSTAPPAGRHVFARLRLGVVVVVRVPGRLVHRISLEGLRARRVGSSTRMELIVANRGNVDEWLARGRISVTLVRGGWRLAGVPVEGRRLLARSSGLVEARFRGRLRGPVDVIVQIRRPRDGVVVARRRYHLTL